MVTAKKEKKRCLIKREIKFERLQKCLQKNKTVLKTQQWFRSKAQNIFTEKRNKIALSPRDGKILQMYDGVISNP